MGCDLIVISLVVIVVVTLENKVNSEPDLFKFVQVGFQVGLEFDNKSILYYPTQNILFCVVQVIQK